MFVRRRLLLSALGVSLLAVAPANSQPVPLLWTSSPDRSPLERAEPEVRRQRRVLVDVNGLKSANNDRFRLPLFGTLEIQIVKDREDRSRPNTLLWVGHVDGDPGSLAVFATVGNTVSGNIVTRWQQRRLATYHVRDLGNRAWALRQVEAFRFPRDSPPSAPTVEVPTAPSVCPSDTGDTIDLLVAYTDDVVGNASSVSAVEADVLVATELINVSFAASGITTRVKLVQMKKVDYTESRDATTDRDRLQNPADGKLDELHGLRDTQAADVVVLVVQRLDNACGKTNLMESISAGFAPFAFAVVRKSCAADNFSLAHEVGHVLGARHDRFSDGVGQMPGFNFGHVRKNPSAPGTPWYTIMATFLECQQAPVVECDRIPFWSNPEMKTPANLGGNDLGTATADNRRHIHEAAATVANFRCSAPRPD